MKRLILAVLTGAAFAVSSPAYAAVKTIVLVHGAFADGSGWKPIADILVSHGYSVRVVQEPETSFLTPTWLRRGAFSTRPVLAFWSGTAMAA
jgi:triacylglycerol esterase/lipase EstA (alpha/beta hydrolase family)